MDVVEAVARNVLAQLLEFAALAHLALGVDAEEGRVEPVHVFEEAAAPRDDLARRVDDRAQLLIEIEYAAHAALELNRHKVASDPMVRTFLQGWRAILAGSADMDVYEDVTG